MKIDISVTKEKPFSFLVDMNPLWTAIVAVVGITGITAAVIMKHIMKRKESN